MGNESPDPRAKAIADKLLGKGGNDVTAATNLLATGAATGRRDDDGKPIADSVRKVGEITSPPRGRQAIVNKQETVDDDDEEDYLDPDAEAGEDGAGLDEEHVGEGEDTEADDTNEEDPDEQDGEEYEEVDYSDDDEFEVTVDGETRTATLRDLKKAFSGEGAIEKRLQEATAARAEATQTREAVLQEVTAHRAGLMQTIQQLDQVLFMPMVDEPDPKLRATNINQYLMQKDAWEEDQKRIVKSRTDLQQFFVGQQQETAKARETFRQEQVALLVQKMPELTDPVKGPKLNRQILDAAAVYGFTAEQVAQVDNHGLFLMARDAARWQNLQKIKQNGGPVFCLGN